MAKKSRQQRRVSPRPSTISRSETSAASREFKTPDSSIISTQQAEPTSPRKTPDFSKEYHYVINDLKRVGILAAVLFLGLILLSFVL